MKVSTKGRYSLRLLLDLAEHADKGFIPLKDIADRQEISKKYLEQIVALLNVSGMLRTNRGYQGGYMLAKAPQEYSVGQILRITEGGLLPVACLENDPNTCPRNSYCKTLPVWEGLNRVISDYLDGITLRDLLGETKALKEEGEIADAAPPAPEAIEPPGAPETSAQPSAQETSVQPSAPEISAQPNAPEASAPPPEPKMDAPKARPKSDRWFWNSF